MAQRLVPRSERSATPGSPTPAARASAARANRPVLRCSISCSTTLGHVGRRPRAPKPAAEAIRLGRTLAGSCPTSPSGRIARIDAVARRRAGLSVRPRRQSRATRSAGSQPVNARSSPKRSRCSKPALRRSRPGPYQVQAAIAACHATASMLRGHRLERIAAVRRAGEDERLAGDRAESRGCGCDGEWSRSRSRNRRRARRRPARSTAITCCPARADLLRRLGRHDEAADEYLKRRLALADGRRRAALPQPPTR